VPYSSTPQRSNYRVKEHLGWHHFKAHPEGRATMGRRLSSSRLKGKSPLAMELIANRYRNG
jgi:hypothetical protein